MVGLVSCVWQTALLLVSFQPREGRASSRGKLSSFCQTTGKRRSLSLLLCLSLPIPRLVSSCQHVPLVQSFVFTVPVSLFSAWLCRINRRVSEDENTKRPRGVRPIIALTPSLLAPEGHSSHPTVVTESDIKTDSWVRVKDALCVLPQGESSIYATGMMPTTQPNPLFAGTSLSPAQCYHRMCVQTDLWGQPENIMRG